MKLKILLAVAAITLINAPAFADDNDAAEVAALKAEVKALETRIDKLEKREKAQAAVASQTGQYAVSSPNNLPALANTGNRTLSQRVTVLEQQQQAEQANTPSIHVGADGLTIASPDKQYSLNFHGYVQLDDRIFPDGGTKSGLTDTFLIRSARPIFEAKMTDYFDTRFMVDFGKGQSTLLDAYGNIHPMPDSDYDWVNFRAGEFKTPVGLERWENESKVLFVERGQTTNLVPYRDIGIMAYGYPFANQVEYEFGIMNGAADYQVNTGDTDQDKDIVGRIFTHPLAWTGEEALKGLGVGVAGTYGNHQGTPTSSGLTTGYVTVGQRAFFTYSNANDFANGTQWRLNPQAMYYNGSFGSFAEYIVNSQEVGHGATIPTATTVELRNTAWEGVASYVLTGENAAFDGVKPARDFNPAAGDWGAFELLGRVSDLEVDKRAFPTFASLATSSSSAFERTVGATWYFNQAVKLNLDFSYTTFDHGALNDADHEAERAVMSRLQMKF